jgi:hypothetical protein
MTVGRNPKVHFSPISASEPQLAAMSDPQQKNKPIVKQIMKPQTRTIMTMLTIWKLLKIEKMRRQKCRRESLAKPRIRGCSQNITHVTCQGIMVSRKAQYKASMVPNTYLCGGDPLTRCCIDPDLNVGRTGMGAYGIVCRSPNEYDREGIAKYLRHLRQLNSVRACSGSVIRTKARTA